MSEKKAILLFKKFDIGDIIGIKGIVFRTQKEEISIRANEITLLSKRALRFFRNSTDLTTRNSDTDRIP